MPRRLVIWWLCCGLLLTPVGLLACGTLFSTVVVEPIAAPQHRAILLHDAGQETLILQESFTGLDEDFAWVIPTPAYPTVTLATPTLFNILHYHTRPHNEAETTPWVLLALGLASVFLTLVIFGTFRMYPCLLCLCGLSVAALLCASPGATVSWGIPLNIYFAVLLALTLLLTLGFRLRVGSFLALLCFLVVLSALLLPNFISYQSSGNTLSSVKLDTVTVHERTQVGIYDIRILSARDPDALRHWLQAHGYQHHAPSAALLQEYVQHGWFFIATRLRPAAGAREHSPTTAAAAIPASKQHGGVLRVPRVPQLRAAQGRTQHGNVPPLQVSFAAAKPIYPLKLAALGPSAAEIVLYVFAPRRVQADGFTVTFAEHVQHMSLGGQRRLDPSVLPFVPANFYLTKLEATLAPGDITADVEITGARSQKAFRLTRYSDEILQWLAIDGGLLGALLTLGLFWYRDTITARAHSPALVASTSVGLGLLIACCVYYVVPPIPTARMVWRRSGPAAAVATAESIRAALMSYAADRPDHRYPPTAALASYPDLVRIVNANGGTLPASEDHVFLVDYTSEGDDTYTLLLAMGDVSGGVTEGMLVVTPQSITRCPWDCP